MIETTTAVGGRVFEGISGVAADSGVPIGSMPTADVSREDLLATVTELRRRGFTHLALLTATEPLPATEPADTPEPSVGLDLIYALTRQPDTTTIALKVRLAENDLSAPSLSGIWKGAAPLEREVWDLFGVTFTGHPALTRIVLRDDFAGHPLRKSWELSPEGVSADTVAAATASHGDLPHPDVEHSPFDEVEHEGDAVLHSERLVLNMGPQHPSMHGVLHLWLALDGEQVVSAEPTHGYLHRCIEKLSETRSYRAAIALLDRCDYVSGFHTELAYLLALEEMLGIEPTPKGEYLRVLMSELVRITSHHTWLAAAGLDTGALTPFLYAFIDREIILDFFEAATGGRMMFNYFRPGGVKDDLPVEATRALHAYLKTFNSAVDDYEGLLSANEIFRTRTRGVGVLSPDVAETYGVTGPMARASGIDVDLRRDEPYSAYADFRVEVPLGEAGDTYDRYTVRIAEMRESARLALAALEGMPEGPHVAEGVPRTIKPAPGMAYRRVESPRGELGVLLVSDGTAQPWRLKVRSPAFSNLHCSPAILQGGRVGDVVAVLGSVDVVLGEIDR